MRFLIIPLIFCSLFSFSQSSTDISVENLKKHVSFLASDSLYGRKPGTLYDSISADYIFQQFKNAGLKFFNNNPYQSFEVINSAYFGNKNSFIINNNRLDFLIDFEPHYNSLSGNFSGKVAFVGYGINSEEIKRNDFDKIDINSKWAMMLVGIPEIGNNEISLSSIASLTKKILNVKERNGIGILLIVDEQEKKLFNNYIYNINFGIPVILITKKTANEILKPSKQKLKNIKKDIDIKTNSFFIDIDVKSEVEIIIEKKKTQNILCYIEGNDEILKNEYIVIGGHYDHLGMGGPQTNSRKPDTVAVHNGADDNASGTAAVIELAEKFYNKRVSLKRSIIFIAFTAEEMGLLGSKYFVENPPVDLKKIVYMANFDMIGRMNDNPVQLLAGASALEFDSLVEKVVKKVPINHKIGRGASSGSDHAAFYYENIPVVFFFTGIHSDYHTPFDDIEKINFDNSKLILDFSFELLTEIANSPNKLTFNKLSSGQSSGRPKMKVTFGIMPDFTASDTKGVLVGGVNQDGPADKAGILKGDIIKSINGKELENIYDYMSKLGEINKGQSIEVIIERSNEKITKKVDF